MTDKDDTSGKNETNQGGDKKAPKVGYKNPPKHTQFKKGQSGNPKGRPKAQKKLTFEDLDALLSEPVSIKKNGSMVKMSPFEVEMRTLARKAIKGDDLKAIDRLLRYFKKYELIADAPAETAGGVVTIPDTEEMPYGQGHYSLD